MWIRFRKWLHPRLFGHEANYIVSRGSLTGTPYLFCTVCLKQNDEYQIKRAKEMKEKANA